MTLAQEVTDLAVRVGTEFNTVRTEVDSTTGVLTSLTTTDKTNLVAAINEVQSEVGGGGATNLATTLSATQTIVTSDTGTDATIPAADATNAGVMTAAMQTKLAGIEAAADVTDAGNIASSINGASAKTTPIDADLVGLIDTEASNVLKKLTLANLKNLVIAAIQTGAPEALNTIDEIAAALQDNPNQITEILTAQALRVRVDTAAQGLTDTQKGNARTNIAAASSVDVGDTARDFVADFEGALA